VRVVLHPAELPYGDGAADLPALRRGLLERSRGFFAAAVERLAGSPSGVRVVVEHQVPPAPREAVIRIGDTYAELLEVVAAVDLGLCWDTGHYLLSVQRRGQDPLPPDAFLRRVELVHLHDVTSAQWDHQVIRRGSEPLRRYVQLLCQAGFSGGVTLEYSAEAIRSAGSFERVIADSLDALSAWLQ
jgi:sugar phosphate isomerase/epimerase